MAHLDQVETRKKSDSNTLPGKKTFRHTSSQSISNASTLTNQTIKKSVDGKSKISLPILLAEIIVATILKFFGGSYFISPIENLAMSTLASFLINDPSDCLSYATSCSVLYAVVFNLCQKLSPFLNARNYLLWKPPFHWDPSSTTTNNFGGTNGYNNTHSWLNLFFPLKLIYIMIYPQWLTLFEKYIRHLRYYLCFHIIVYQFTQSFMNPYYYNEASTSTSSSKNRSSNPLFKGKSFLKNENLNRSTQRVASNGSNRVVSSGNSNTNPHYQPETPNVQQQQQQQNNSNESRAPHLINNLKDATPTPYFTSTVKNYKVFDPIVTVAEDTNLQAVTTTFDDNENNLNKNISTNSTDNTTFKNQLFEMEIDLDNINQETNNLRTDLTVTSNLENFIRHLFKRKNQHLIPPLWSMFVTLKTTNFEKKYLNQYKKVVNNTLTPVSSYANANENEPQSNITPINSNNSISHTVITDPSDTLARKSVFNNADPAKAMAIIAQTTSDDYDQLNLVSTRMNIFNRDDNEYKVCIIDIGTHSITFHIENLHDGELIVLVNGLIWSEVSCALILERVGEEYVVVSGLVPSCSYDIQFVNRLDQTDDYLISDLMIRTSSILNNDSSNDKTEVSENFENLDFSFPSYYHRKFLSPLLTLKHSVLTTNANLADERNKIKKTKKEINKKLNSLRQEIDHFKGKIEQNATNDEKNTSKVDNLKIALQQNEKASFEAIGRRFETGIRKGTCFRRRLLN